MQFHVPYRRRMLVVGGVALGLTMFAMTGRAGIVVTKNRKVQLGSVSVKGDMINVQAPFGTIGFTKDKVAWYNTDEDVDSCLKAGRKAEAEGLDALAMFLYQTSAQREESTRQTALDAMKEAHRRRVGTETLDEMSKPDEPVGQAPATVVKTVQPPRQNKILDALRDDLVRIKKGGRSLEKLVGNDVPDVDYYALYFSAHWCGPCRHFTPSLVGTYNELQAKYRNKFEVIFVSRDRSSRDMEKYMEETVMPWSAQKFTAIKKSSLNKYQGPGIPCLVLVDRDGKVISDSYVDGRYVGPHKVVTDLRRILERSE